MSAEILLVEDDPALLAILRASTDFGGFSNRPVANGEDAISELEGGGIDAVLLDLGLPDYDGKDLLKKLRSISDVPIIVVSGRGTEADKIEALDLGADDYVAKPFLPGELLARIRAALRRYASRQDRPETGGSADDADRHPTSYGALSLDPLDTSASLHGLKVVLNAAEYQVLRALAAATGTVVSRRQLLEVLYGETPPEDTNVVDVYISRIRAKLRRLPGGEDLLSTVRGQGWRLRMPG